MARGWEFGRDGVERVNLLQRNEASDGFRLPRAFRLCVVEVAVGGWGHDDIVPGFCCGQAAIGAAPGHDGRTGGETALKDLIPADQPAAFGGKELLKAMVEPCLEFRLVLETLGLDSCLAFWTLFPAVARGLVPADMDESPGKEFADFGQNILRKGDCGVVARAEDVGLHTPAGAHLERSAGAGEFRVGRKGGAEMARDLDLRHQRHMPGPGVGHNVPDFLLCVKERPVGLAIPLIPVPWLWRLRPPGSDLREARVFFDLQTPSLIIGEVELQAVELVVRHDVHEAFDVFRRQKVTGRIEEQAPPGESWLVPDLHATHVPEGSRALRGRVVVECFGGQKLAQCHPAIKQACGSAGRDGDAVAGDGEAVTLSTDQRICRGDDHGNIPFPGRGFDHGQPPSQRCGEIPGELVGLDGGAIPC